MLKELDSIANKLNEERGVLIRTLGSLSEEQAAQISVTPEWSVKDAVAHLAGAERGMFGIAQRAARGESPHLPEGYDNDVYNARQVAKRQERTLAEVRAELDGSRAELLAFLGGLTADQLALAGEHPLEGHITLKELLVIIYSHEMTHANEIADKIRQARP
ncbi:MAG: DinB family protein [Chloroflexi bacterium]|nr:DinB family protein [Chloroflexota bacterium]